MTLAPEQEDGWLRLNALEFSPKRARALLDAFGGDPAALFAASGRDWRERLPGLSDKQRERLSAIQSRTLTAERDALRRAGAHVLPFNDPAYPVNLKQLPDAPSVLMVRGELVPDDKFSVAIVGSRRATPYGLNLAKQFGRELAAHGLTVVSGGAKGVDTLAHEGALDGSGRTIAFLGCGVDVPYPPANRRLFETIAAGRGAVVSEFPMGTKPEPWRFPARNRLISGCSLGVLVLESPADSGALITAREAADQGRDVFAVPGSVVSGLNAGGHKLIQDGAKLVETVDDILNELGVLRLRAPEPATENENTPVPTVKPAAVAASKPLPNLPPEQKRVLELLTLQARPADTIITESGLPAPQVIGILTLLEIAGLVRRLPGNTFVRVL